MITREQIEEIQAESLEKVISIKHVLQEKGFPRINTFGGSESIRDRIYQGDSSR